MRAISVETRVNILQDWMRNKTTIRKLAKYYKVSAGGVYHIIRKFGETGEVQDLPKAPKKRGTTDPLMDTKVVKLFEQNKSITVRKVARKTGLSVGTVQNIKKRKGLKTYTKRKVPKRTEKQDITARKRAGLLYNHLRANKQRCILMDDETYVKMDANTIPLKQFYTIRKGDTPSDKDSTIRVGKFDKKVLVWQAICSCGSKSTAFFTTGTINQAVYQKECIKKRLLPLYRKHDIPPIFWPDLATAHYARGTLELLQALNIDFIQKSMNPPNCPQLRPIERYWAFVKRNLSKTKTAAGTIDEFKKMWRSSAHKVTKDGVQKLMRRILAKVRLFYRGDSN